MQDDSIDEGRPLETFASLGPGDPLFSTLGGNVRYTRNLGSAPMVVADSSQAGAPRDILSTSPTLELTVRLDILSLHFSCA